MAFSPMIMIIYVLKVTIETPNVTNKIELLRPTEATFYPANQIEERSEKFL